MEAAAAKSVFKSQGVDRNDNHDPLQSDQKMSTDPSVSPTTPPLACSTEPTKWSGWKQSHSDLTPSPVETSVPDQLVPNTTPSQARSVSLSASSTLSSPGGRQTPSCGDKRRSKVSQKSMKISRDRNSNDAREKGGKIVNALKKQFYKGEAGDGRVPVFLDR